MARDIDKYRLVGSDPTDLFGRDLKLYHWIGSQISWSANKRGEIVWENKVYHLPYPTLALYYFVYVPCLVVSRFPNSLLISNIRKAIVFFVRRKLIRRETLRRKKFVGEKGSWYTPSFFLWTLWRTVWLTILESIYIFIRFLDRLIVKQR